MSLFHIGKAPALDASGNPISGATWNFYTTGTTTPQAVYSNNSLGTSLGSTVTANSAGRFAPIFLDDAITYRAILKDAGGTTIPDFDIDPVNIDTAVTSISGDSANVFHIVYADSTNALNVNTVTPYVSVAGTRTTKAPRITAGSGTDANYDSFLTSNCVATGATLFRDEFQDMSTFTGLNAAHCSFDAFSNFTGTSAMNHARGFQARTKISLTGGVLLSEWTGHFVQPIFDGTFNIDQTAALWIRNPQVVSGTQNLFSPYGVLIEDGPNWGANFIPIAVFSTKPNYIGGHIQMGTTADVYGGREVRANAVHGVGTIGTYQASGGVALYAPGGGSAAVIEAYTDGSATAGPLAIKGTQVRIGSTTGIASKALEVTGAVLSTAGYYYNSNQVVGARSTGWTAMTGTGSKGALAAAAAGTASVGYVQAETQGALNRIAALEARLKSLDDALVAHGLIGA